MEYAYRVRDALIEMNPGEVGIWRLPPMTPGSIIIKTYYAMPAGWSGGAGGSPRSTRSNPVGAGRGMVREGGLGAGDVGTMARDARPWQPGIGGGLEIDPGDLGGSFGETMELTLELLRVGSPVAVGLNHILHGTPNSGDIWALRITRKNDGSLDRRRYRVHVQYPSVLPLEVRRVPIGFLNRGFDANWNDNPYLDWIQIRDNVLSYQWDRDFAALYHLPTDNVHVPLGDRVIFPTIKSIALRLLAGGGPDPIAPLIPNQVVRDMPFFALRIDCTYEGSRTVELEIPGSNPTFTLPDPLWIIARFYLAPSNGGMLTYYTEVESPLLDAIDRDFSYPTLSGGMETVNLKHVVKEALEDYLYGLQFGEHGKRLDSLRRWLVGRYEVVGTGYDRNAEEMVFTYVGRQRPPPPLPLSAHHIATHMSLGTTPAQPEPTWPRLFDTPFEMPLPAPEGGLGGLSPAHDAGALNKIEHIVVLMQENRSFDQVLGYLSRDGMVQRSALLSRSPNAAREVPMSPTDVDGLLKDEPNAPNTRDAIRYPDQPGGPVYRCARSFTSGWRSFALDNPCHGHDCVERQVSDGMKGFIADYARKPGMGAAEFQLIMNYMTDIELPTFGALTREFAICDKWFCSHIGGTLPNRFINLTGDLGEDVYGSPEVENPDLFSAFAPLEATTFFEHLSARNVSWTLFEHNYCTLRMFRKYTFDERNTVGFNDPVRGFEKMARDGTLPAVSFIEPDYIEAPGGNDDHAPADMINGQVLIARIMAALLDSPQWSKTLFIITYDEHGGFYDHVPLPFEVTTTAADGTVTTRNNAPLSNGERRFGVRVPAFVISPLIPSMPGGKVNASHTVFDHTSITATILRRFCGTRLPDMGPRVNAAADLRHLLTLDVARPRTDFDALAAEMRTIAQWQTVALAGVPPPPLRRPDGQLEDFHALVAYATCITGKGRQ
jgi:phospholipase C